LLPSFPQPALHEVNSVKALNESLSQLYNSIFDKTKTAQDLKGTSAWVDVRDLGEAHVRALRMAAAGGERIIVSSGTFRSLFH
jgi:nucleoside-diphosphate-sugar epimerase